MGKGRERLEGSRSGRGSVDRVRGAWWPEVVGGTGAPSGSRMPPDSRREHWQARHRVRARTAWRLQRRAPAADRGVAEL